MTRNLALICLACIVCCSVASAEPQKFARFQAGDTVAYGLVEGDRIRQLDLQLTLRLNGEVKQGDNTSHLIHDVASTVSFISQHITLHPGDLIFTGTPGKTDVIKAGDVIEVELEGVGVLRNQVE